MWISFDCGVVNINLFASMCAARAQIYVVDAYMYAAMPRLLESGLFQLTDNDSALNNRYSRPVLCHYSFEVDARK